MRGVPGQNRGTEEGYRATRTLREMRTQGSHREQSAPVLPQLLEDRPPTTPQSPPPRGQPALAPRRPQTPAAGARLRQNPAERTGDIQGQAPGRGTQQGTTPREGVGGGPPSLRSSPNMQSRRTNPQQPTAIPQQGNPVRGV